MQLLTRFPLKFTATAAAPVSVALLATALDPRFHWLRSLPTDAAHKVWAAIEVAARVELTPSPAARPSADDELLVNRASTNHQENMSSLLAYMEVNQDEAPSEPENSLTEEIDKFRSEKQTPFQANPLDWWKLNSGHFPLLSCMARKLLAIPATSAPSERVFSAAGHIVNKRRASLSSENVEMLVFLATNKNLI